MSKYTEIFEYMRQCPRLKSLWSIGATENENISVILPQGASPAVQYDESIDVCGNYEGEIIPFPSVYEDYEINCYKFYDSNDSNAPKTNLNVMSLEQVQEICDWIIAQNESGNLPNITGEQVISIECEPFVPRIRYVNEKENIIAYYITVRIRYVNRRRQKTVVFNGD